MAKKEFSYQEQVIRPNAAFPEGVVAHRPIASARITASNGHSYDWYVLPDSGADSCMFPLSLADALRLDYSTMPRAQTAGVGASTNATYYDTLSIDLGDGLVFDAYACFTPGLNKLGLGILGQSGFFENFNVEFRHRKKIFTVERS